MPRRVSYEGEHYNTQIAYTAYSSSIDVKMAKGFFVGSTITDATPTAKTFQNTAVNTTSDQITIASHGLPTGLIGQLTTTNTLPGGLSVNTDYYVISIDTNTIALASSLANAQANTAIDIANTGVGNHTFTATAFSATWALQTYNGTSWVNTAGTNQAISSNSTVSASVVDPMYKLARIAHFMTAGYARFVDNVIVKEDYSGS